MQTFSKSEIINAFKAKLQHKIDDANQAIKDIIKSRDSESKSSAGDKYETGRAMAQIAQQQNEAQLSQLIKQYQQIDIVNPTKTSSTIEFGSFVQTKKHYFFISTGIGNISIKGIPVYGMSITSPLGEALRDKSKGDKVEFNNITYEIIEVL